jgi:hypothetical protein
MKFLRSAVEVLDMELPLHVLSRRKRRVVEARLAEVNSLPRARAYDEVELQRGRILAAESKPHIDNAATIQSYIRAIALALASERPLDFETIYDQMLDSDLPDEAKDLVASATLDMQAADLMIVEVTEVPLPPNSPTTPRAGAGVPGIIRGD